MINKEAQRLLKELMSKSKNAIIIVEGKNDKLALESLQVNADFFLLCRQNKSLPESAEEISKNYKKAILMLDQDKKGKELEKKMIHYLQKFGVRVNRDLGKKILSLANVSTVEGINRF